MRILRIEDNYGVGMYHSELAYQIPSMFDTYAHPEPDSDLLMISQFKKRFNGKYPYGWRSGFVSVEQLTDWIYKPSWQKKVAEYFWLSVYEVPADWVVIGERQALFMRESLPVEQFNLIDYIYVSEGVLVPCGLT